MQDRKLALLATTVSLMLMGCAMGGSEPGMRRTASAEGAKVEVVSFPQLVEYPGRIRMEALLGGMLLVEDGCFRVAAGNGETRLIIWSPDVILLPDRKTVRSESTGQTARVGDTINFSGGEASDQGLAQHKLKSTTPSKCAGPYAIMSEGFTSVTKGY